MYRRQAKTRGHKIWRMPGKKPQCEENPLIKSSSYYSIVQQRERVHRSNSLAQYIVKKTLTKSTVSNTQLQSQLESQCWSNQYQNILQAAWSKTVQFSLPGESKLAQNSLVKLSKERETLL